MKPILTMFAVCSHVLGYAQAEPLVITEVMANPPGSEFRNEYVEVWNASPDSVDMTGWQIGDGSSTDLLIFPSGTWLKAGGYGLIYDPDYGEGTRPYGDLTADLLAAIADHAIGSAGLDNVTAETVELRDSSGRLVHAITYDLVEDGYSYEIDNPESDRSTGSASRWPGGTPGRTNSRSPKRIDLELRVLEAPEDAPGDGMMTVKFEVLNLGRSEAAGGIRVTWSDTFTTIVHEAIDPGASLVLEAHLPAPNGKVIDYQAMLLVMGDEDPLNDTVTWQVRYGVPVGALIITELMPDPLDGGEWVEVLNLSGGTVDLDGWTIVDASGRAGTLSEHQVKANRYLIISEDPQSVEAVAAEPWPLLNNSGDLVRIVDGSGAVIDEVVYSESLKGYSIERISMNTPSGVASNWLINRIDEGGTPGRVNRSEFTETGLSVKAEPEAFVETTLIRIEQPESRELRVYDRRGRLRKTLLSGVEVGTMAEIAWDGRDDSGSPLRAGVYILSLESSGPQGGISRAKGIVSIVKGL